MIPGEIKTPKGDIILNEGRKTKSLRVANTGDRPIQVGSHYHFAEVNRELAFERSNAYGMRLNIAAGTAVRFEPGEEKLVELVEVGGSKAIYGLNGLTNGELEQLRTLFNQRVTERQFKGGEKAK
ncbi:urease subunit beta [Bacillus solitudinis]|uniref:urease subunit beta n=1 Tax=Bacillus solitudinis TaxID=2014074 RepID=UPI000C24AA2B|nr:urease subunit beta [Bacillus solitudinis]